MKQSIFCLKNRGLYILCLFSFGCSHSSWQRPEYYHRNGDRYGIDGVVLSKGEYEFSKGEYEFIEKNKLAEDLNVLSMDGDIEFKKEKFCHNGRQITAIKSSVTLVLPNIEKGIPIDTAVKIRNQDLVDGRKIITEFYDRTSDFEYLMSRKLYQRANGGLSATSPLILALDGNLNGKNIISHLKIFVVNDFLNRGSFLFFNDRIIFGALPGIAISYEHHDGMYHSMPQGIVGILPGAIYKWNEVLPAQNVDFIDGTKAIRPLAPAILGPILVLRSLFTMYIPKGLQNQLKFKKAEYEPWDSFGYRGDKFHASILLQQTKELWKEYFKKFTTIKEAPTSDSQIYEYEVSLNLNLFCQYGRPISDFTSK